MTKLIEENDIINYKNSKNVLDFIDNLNFLIKKYFKELSVEIIKIDSDAFHGVKVIDNFFHFHPNFHEINGEKLNTLNFRLIYETDIKNRNTRQISIFHDWITKNLYLNHYCGGNGFESENKMIYRYLYFIKCKDFPFLTLNNIEENLKNNENYHYNPKELLTNANYNVLDFSNEKIKLLIDNHLKKGYKTSFEKELYYNLLEKKILLKNIKSNNLTNLNQKNKI